MDLFVEGVLCPVKLIDSHKRCSSLFKLSCTPCSRASVLFNSKSEYLLEAAVSQWVFRGPGFDTRSGNILSFLIPLFSSPEPKAQGELLPSANVRRPLCDVCRQQLLQTTSPETARPRTLIFGM